MKSNIESKLAGKIALVTGASKGIGAAIAKHLAAAGASVVVNYASSKAGAEKVVAAITAAGGQAIALQGDLAQPADISHLLAETRRAFGRLDILVNNAGVYEFSPLETVTPEFFRRQFDINVLGLLLTTQEAVKLFPETGGSIINVSSVVTSLTPPNSSVYTGTKGAQSAGIIGSDSERHAISQTPLGRTGQPQDIATIAVFLASDDSGWLTGELVRAGGGLN